jgi:hypothetical protein
MLIQHLRYVRNTAPDVYDRYLYDRTIMDMIVDYLAHCERPPTLAQLVTELRRRSLSQSSWLIEVPLTNLEAPEDVLPLGFGRLLVRGDERRDAMRDGSHLDVFAVHRHLGDRLPGRGRWLPAAGSRDTAVDTRATAFLHLVEEGTEELAVNLAETRAKYALAVWCLLKQPRMTKAARPTWPSATYWLPAPYLRYGPLHKPYEPRGTLTGGSSRRSAIITEHGLYRLTTRREVLMAPFEAMEKAHRGNQCALALLSAARSLYLAAAYATDFERTERIMHLWAAREALADPGRARGRGTADDRWDRLVKNLRLRGSLTKSGYDRAEVDAALALLHSIRDLATHRAEDVLVNLSFPSALSVHLHEARRLDADALALSRIVSAFPILYRLVWKAAMRLTEDAIKSGWDERGFHRRFK